jgi:FixJ family two-component response regulator
MARQSPWYAAFVLITGAPDAMQIIEALRQGAYDFLLKPFTVDVLFPLRHRTPALPRAGLVVESL